MNAKSGLCPEDCGYCSQSKVSEAEIPRYNLLNAAEAAGRRPRGRRAAGQDLLHRDLGPRTFAARDGRHHHDRAADQGAVRPEDLRLPGACSRPSRPSELKACGVDRVNHNLNTSDAVLQRDLLDPHLRRPRGHAAKRSAPRAWNCARAASSAWASRTPTSCAWPSPCASWTSNRSRLISRTPSTARRWPARDSARTRATA